MQHEMLNFAFFCKNRDTYAEHMNEQDIFVFLIKIKIF